jgi:hypothetical protein
MEPTILRVGQMNVYAGKELVDPEHAIIATCYRLAYSYKLNKKKIGDKCGDKFGDKRLYAERNYVSARVTHPGR